MPQLNVADFVPQLVWLAITFTLLYFLMARVALPRVATAIEERNARVADDLDRAEQDRRAAEEARTAYESALAEARAKAHEIGVEAKRALTAELDRRKAEYAAKIAAESTAAEKRILAAVDTARAKLGDIARDAAQAVAEQLLGQPVDRAAAARAVELVLAERGGKI